MTTRIPQLGGPLYRDKFIYRQYDDNLVYYHPDTLPYIAVPSEWIPSPDTAFTVGQEKHLSVLEAGTLTWSNNTLENHIGCCIAIIVDISSDTDVNLTIESVADASTNESILLSMETEDNLLTLGTLSDSSNTILDSHPLSDDKAYRLELWIFDDMAWGILNGAVLLEYSTGASVLSLLTHPVITIEANADGTLPTILQIAMNELVATPDAQLEADGSNQFVQLRKSLMDTVNNVEYEDWGAFKLAYHRWLKLRHIRYPDRDWNRIFGYPVREPTTEEWLNPE